MPRMQTMTRMFGLELGLELADCTTWWRWQGTLINSSLKTNYLKLSSKDEKREKISKNCVLVFGKVKQNRDGEVRISLGKWSNLLGKWSKLLGRWSNLLGKWSKFGGEMKQNDGQMKQNLMGRCPIDKVHTTQTTKPNFGTGYSSVINDFFRVPLNCGWVWDFFWKVWPKNTVCCCLKMLKFCVASLLPPSPVLPVTQ